MPSITVKNISPELYKRLKASAEANRRSLNSEIIACIEQTVTSRKINPEEFLERARKLRAKTSASPLTDETFNQAKHASRP